MNSMLFVILLIAIVLVSAQDEADQRKPIGQRLCAKDYVARPDAEQGDKPVGIERPAPADLDETNDDLAGLEKRVRDRVVEEKEERAQDVLNAEARRQHWEQARAKAAERLTELQKIAKRRFYESFCSRLGADAMVPEGSGELTDSQRQRLAALAECAETRDTLQPCTDGQQPIVEGKVCYQCIPTVTRIGTTTMTEQEKQTRFTERLTRCTQYCTSKTPADVCNVQEADFDATKSLYDFKWGCKQTLAEGGTTHTWGDGTRTATTAGKRQSTSQTLTDRHSFSGAGDSSSQTMDWSSTEQALRERLHQEAVNATVRAAARCAELKTEFGTPEATQPAQADVLKKRQDDAAGAAADEATDFCAAAKALYDAAFDCRDKVADPAAFEQCREDFTRQLQIQDLEACRAQRAETRSTLENRDRDDARKERAQRDRDAAAKVADALSAVAADQSCAAAAQQCRDWRRACRVKRADRDAERAKTGGITVRTDADHKPLGDLLGADAGKATTPSAAVKRQRQPSDEGAPAEKVAGDALASPKPAERDCSDSAFRQHCHGYRKCLREKTQAKQVSAFERCVRQEKKRVAFTHVECFSPDSTEAPLTDAAQAADLAGEDPATRKEIETQESFEAFSSAAFERIDRRVRDFCNATRPVDKPMPAKLKCLCDSIASDSQLFFKTETYDVKWFRSPEQLVCKLARCQCTAASLLQRFAKCTIAPPTVTGSDDGVSSPNKRQSMLNGDEAFTELLQAAVADDPAFESVSVVDAGTDTTLPLEVLAPVDQLLVGYPDDGATAAEEKMDPLGVSGEEEESSASSSLISIGLAIAASILVIA